MQIGSSRNSLLKHKKPDLLISDLRCPGGGADYFILKYRTMMIKELIFRMGKPTPKFYRDLRNVGLAVGAIGTALLSAAVVSLGGYLVVGGTVMGIISQSATERWHLQKKVHGRYAKGLLFEEEG